MLAAKKQFLSYVWEEVQVLLASESQAILVRRNLFKTTKSIAALAGDWIWNRRTRERIACEYQLVKWYAGNGRKPVVSGDRRD